MMRLSVNEPQHGRCPDCGADMVMGSPESNAPGKLWCSNSEHDDWVRETRIRAQMAAKQVPAAMPYLVPEHDAADEGLSPLLYAAFSEEAQAVDEATREEPEPTHAEIHARLQMSVQLAKQARRIAELEEKVEGQRHAINRLLSALIVAGIWPKSMAGADITADPLTPL